MAELVASLPEALRSEALKEIDDKAAYELLYDWSFWARPKQLTPQGEWRIWYIRAGRGWGKTRTGAEWINEQVRKHGRKHIALVNDTTRDVRDIMVEGKSGVLNVSRQDFKPIYEPSKSRVVWPNGAVAHLHSAEAPELLRGPEFDCAWCDEPAKWRNLRKRDPDANTAWDNIMMALRLGTNPQCIVTTTPRAAFTRMIKNKKGLVVTTGSTFENRANLAEPWFQDIVSSYENTRIGRQELLAEELEDVEGALWTAELIERNRVQVKPELMRVVIGVDPATTSSELSDEAGIVVGGLGKDGHCYIFDDLSLRSSPAVWARTAIAGYYKHFADRILAETNNGGEMIEILLRTIDQNVSYKGVHASKGKVTRAEPVQALYEQGRVHHVGSLPQLEDEMTQWIPGLPSPNRMDAMVWVVSELFNLSEAQPGIRILDWKK